MNVLKTYWSLSHLRDCTLVRIGVNDAPFHAYRASPPCVKYKTYLKSLLTPNGVLISLPNPNILSCALISHYDSCSRHGRWEKRLKPLFYSNLTSTITLSPLPCRKWHGGDGEASVLSGRDRHGSDGETFVRPGSNWHGGNGEASILPGRDWRGCPMFLSMRNGPADLEELQEHLGIPQDRLAGLLDTPDMVEYLNIRVARHGANAQISLTNLIKYLAGEDSQPTKMHNVGNDAWYQSYCVMMLLRIYHRRGGFWGGCLSRRSVLSLLGGTCK